MRITLTLSSLTCSVSAASKPSAALATKDIQAVATSIALMSTLLFTHPRASMAQISMRSRLNRWQLA